MNKRMILVINPGSTSTKTAVFAGSQVVAEKNLSHKAEDLKQYKQVKDQLSFRKEAILEFLKEIEIPLDRIDCVVARGGLLKPISGGTYLINKTMCRDLIETRQEHASNLGALIAKDLADKKGVPSFIVDPVVVDEMQPLAKISGLKGIERKSIFHALNQKAAARKAAAEIGLEYEKGNFIVAHLGGGISIGAHEQGQVIDVNNALDGDGPFSPERAGGLPVGSIIDRCYNSGIPENELKKEIVGKGGLVSYLETNDARNVEKMIEEGDRYAYLVFEAMAYQVAKEIGICATVLKGQIDAIVLTGGIAYSKRFVQWVKERVDFLALLLVFPGEFEMEALAEGAVRIFNGEEIAKIYG